MRNDAAERFNALPAAKQRAAVRAYRRAVLHVARSFDAMRDLENAMGCDYDGLIDALTFTASGAPTRGDLTLAALADIDAENMISDLETCTEEN
jgi:hypothetical protein